MKLKKAQHLREGDRVGVVTPSWCGPGVFPHRLERGLALLKQLGLEPVLGAKAKTVAGEVAGTPEERAKDINLFFEDPEIKAIFISIGGVYCNELVPWLNYELIRRSPKVVMGYSDATALLLAMYTRAHLMTFYGPMVMTQMAEYPRILPYTLEYFKKTVFTSLPVGVIKPALRWTDEQPSWEGKADLLRERGSKKGSRKWLRPGRATGKIIGGCLNALLRLKGTKYLPSFKKAVLFWEIPEGVKPRYIDLMLCDMAMAGWLDEISGMIVGRPAQYTQKEEELLEEMILKRVRDYEFPILADVEIGHTDPILTVPIGARVSLDSAKKSLDIEEAGVV